MKRPLTLSIRETLKSNTLRPFVKEETFRFKAVVAFVYLQLSGHTRMQCLVFVDTSEKSLSCIVILNSYFCKTIFVSYISFFQGTLKESNDSGRRWPFTNLQSGGAS